MDGYLSSKNVQGINSLMDQLLVESATVNDSRPVISYLANNLSKLDNTTTIEVCEYAIQKLKLRQHQFDEEDTIFKKELADVYIAREDFEKAARTLESINLEHTNRNVNPHEKADVWLSTAESWFEFDDSVNAEKFVNKAAHVMHLVQDDRTLVLRYKNF